jgi:two-component sensor histidine kinase
MKFWLMFNLTALNMVNRVAPSCVLKKIFFLGIYALLIAKSTFASGRFYYPNTDTLLNKAAVLYTKLPQKGITLAKQAYKIAQKNNNQVGEIKSLNLLGKFYVNIRQYDSAGIYAGYNLQAAQKYHIDSLQGDAWRLSALIDHITGNYRRAIEKYNKAILFYTTKNEFSKGLAYLNIGICEQQISQYDEGIKYCLLANHVFEELKDNKNLANTYRAMAICFDSLNNYPKAIEYNKKALIIRENLKDNLSVAQSLNNIGFAYKKYHQADSAIKCLSKSVALYQKERDTSFLILPLQNLGSSWKMKGDLKKAENYILRSLSIAANYDMKEELARGNLDLAELYIEEKKYAAALTAANIAENTVKKSKLPELLMDVYGGKSTLYAQKGDFKKAFLYDNRRNTIKDSLFTISKNKTIEDLEIKYETSQKENDIAALNLQTKLQNKIVGQQKVSITILIIASVLLLVLFVIVYNNFRIKNDANRRIQTLMQDLHHRVKNNLQILSGLFTMQIESLNDESVKNALRENETRLASMNFVHNKLYLDHGNSQIEMREYLIKLMYHIKGSFGGANEEDINLRVDVDAVKLEADKAVAIGLIVNELATNAFKYAFDGSTGEIYLGLKQESRYKLLLYVSDNGKGINENISKKELSFGLKLVYLMAKQLNSTLVVTNANGTSYKMGIDI